MARLGIKVAAFSYVGNDVWGTLIRQRLQAAGLGSLPGGGAEILVDRVRRAVSPCKVGADGWLDICRQWHRLGGRWLGARYFLMVGNGLGAGMYFGGRWLAIDLAGAGPRPAAPGEAAGVNGAHFLVGVDDRLVIDHGASGAPVFDCEGRIAAVISTVITQIFHTPFGRQRISTAWGTPNVVSVPIRELMGPHESQ